MIQSNILHLCNAVVVNGKSPAFLFVQGILWWLRLEKASARTRSCCAAAAAWRVQNSFSFLQNSLPVYERTCMNLGLLHSPSPGIPSCRRQGEKVVQGCRQSLPFVGVMLMCHPSVSALDSLKHSSVLAALKHCELSDTDKSSPTLAAATLQQLNSALKLATH